jgi:hypothetical protein
MKVIYTDAARRDPKTLLVGWRSTIPPLRRPSSSASAPWSPGSVDGRRAQRSPKRPGVRVLPVGRYPYKVFYRITGDAVEILHIHRAAREPWDA